MDWASAGMALLQGVGSLFGGGSGPSGRDRLAERQEQYAIAREFAQNGVQWRVKDAEAAGIHPLAALGFQGPQSPAISIADPVSEPNLPSRLASFGQDISRAMQATRTEKQRTGAMMDLQVENMGLQNDLLRAQIAKTSGAQVGPPMPASLDPRVELVPTEINMGEKNSYAKEAGSLPDYTYARTSTGGLAPVPSLSVKQSIEDTLIPEAMWSFRNLMLPNFGAQGGRPSASEHPLPPGKDAWVWNPLYQEYQPMKKLIGPIHY